MKTIGICLGAWSLSFAHITKNNDKIFINKLHKIIHNGNPQKHLIEYLKNTELDNTTLIATGRKFRKNINITNVSETEASECALSFLQNKYNYPKLDAIASLGAETFLVYDLDNEQHIRSVNSKNKCASGTGEFFLQQLKRMDISVEDAMKSSNNPYKVSGRCSVFCKSDCTHALNIGIEKNRVVSGLASMIADKIIELLPHNINSKILIVGGVSKNKLVIDFLKKVYKNCFIPSEADYFEAIGASIYLIGRNS